MNPDFQRRIQRYGWDKAASYYDTGWEEQLWPAQEQLLEVIDPQPGEQMLDISCGSGLVTLPLAELIMPGGTITGIDISEKMIQQAQARTAQDGIANVTYKRMDAEALELPDQTFDKVVCSLGLMYYPYPEKAMKEMYRVLKPGGLAATLVWGERKNCGWAEIFPIVDRRVETDVCPLFFQLGTGNSLQTAFKKAGFDKVHSKRFDSSLHFKDDEQACTAAFWGGAVALAYQKFEDGIREEVHREYLDSIEPYRISKSYDIPGEFVITKGMKPDE